MPYPKLFLSENIDISQIRLITQIQKFLKRTGVSEDIIHNLSSVQHCYGFTTLWLFAKYISCRPDESESRGHGDDRETETDDIAWLSKAFRAISAWDPNTSPSPEVEDYFKHVIAYVSFFQNGLVVSPEAFPGNLEYLLENTKGTQFKREISIASSFNTEELEKLLALIPEGTLVVVRIAFLDGTLHALGLFKHHLVLDLGAGAQKHIVYSIYDCNSYYGETLYFNTNMASMFLLENMQSRVMSFNVFVPIQKFKPEHCPAAIKLRDLSLASSILYNPENNVTPLFFASSNGCLESVKDIIQSLLQLSRQLSLQLSRQYKFAIKEPIKWVRAYINLKSKDGMTPLICAASFGHHETVRELLHYGANPNIAIADVNGFTVLMLAVHLGHHKVVGELLKTGVTPNSTFCHHTALWHAAQNNKLEVFKELLKYNANPKLDKKESDGSSLILNYAVQNGCSEVFKFISAQFLARFFSSYIEDLLLKAARLGFVDTVLALLARGANPNYADENGQTPLLVAAAAGHNEVVKALLSYDATQPNIVDKHGWTPLMRAAFNGKADTIGILIECGADTTKTNNDGWNALMLAQLNNHNESHKEAIKILSQPQLYPIKNNTCPPVRLTVPDWWSHPDIQKLLNKPHTFTIDLSRADLSGMDLRGLNLKGIIITNATKLERTVFEGRTEYVKYCDDGNPKNILRTLLFRFYLCDGNNDLQGSIFRFFSGAWNRTHVTEVVKFLNSDAIDVSTNIEKAVIVLLCNITNSGKAFNEKGELHKILSFVLQYSSVPKSVNDLIKEVNEQAVRIRMQPPVIAGSNTA